jgi:hypothetical protein
LPPKMRCAPLAVMAAHKILQFPRFVRRTDPSSLGSPRVGPEFWAQHDRARPFSPACGDKFLDLMKLLRGDDVSAALFECLVGVSHGPTQSHSRGLTSMFRATEALAECERSLKKATDRFRPRRNIGLAAAKALYRRHKIMLKSDLDGQVGPSRGSYVHWCISPESSSGPCNLCVLGQWS